MPDLIAWTEPSRCLSGRERHYRLVVGTEADSVPALHQRREFGEELPDSVFHLSRAHLADPLPLRVDFPFLDPVAGHAADHVADLLVHLDPPMRVLAQPEGVRTGIFELHTHKKRPFDALSVFDQRPW
ncbi:hypothetical protein [Nocardia sp. NPDC057440]|uniref:hypothetical protein n=1 Tax=Nocardia sp. NPDC057440 TaxID=3346134 RepID=UPI00366EE071